MTEPLTPERQDPTLAYTVRSRYGDGCVLVFAPTRSKAQMWGAQEIDEEFTGVNVKRSPEFDGFTYETITPADFLARGWWFRCSGYHCQNSVWGDDEERVIEGSHVYCSAACRDGKAP